MTADFTAERSHLAPDSGQAKERALQAADFLRRLLKQVAGVRLLEDGVGAKVTFLTPAPASALVDALAKAGTQIRSEGTWESTVSATVGWWHRRDQLIGLASGVEEFLAGQPLAPVESDRFETIPIDLPRRRPPGVTTS